VAASLRRRHGYRSRSSGRVVLSILIRLRRDLRRDQSDNKDSTTKKSQDSKAKAKQADDNEVLNVGDGDDDEDTIVILDD
jgi:hypothetical protein